MTMIDPFTQKFGKWGSLQAVIAAFADILWSAAILGALGSTLQVRYGVVQFQFYDQSNMVHKEGAAKNQMRKTVGSQRTRLRRFYANFFCVITPNLYSEKAYNRRQIAVKTSKCRDFTQNLFSFFLTSYNGRNIIVITSQRRYFAAISRQKIFAQKERRRRRI